MRRELTDQMVNSGLAGRGITREQALELEFFSHEELDYLFKGTNRLRDRFKGNDVKICSIVNAKSGRCQEDCGFCAQSSQFKTESPEYELLSVDQIVAAAKETNTTVPMVVAMRGTNAEEGIQILADSGLNITGAPDLAGAADVLKEKLLELGGSN